MPLSRAVPAVTVLALIPVAVASPFVQRHFKKGMLTGRSRADGFSPSG